MTNLVRIFAVGLMLAAAGGCQQLMECPVTVPLMRGLGQIAEGSWYTRESPPPPPDTQPATAPAPHVLSEQELVKGH